ncbi:E3 ubiquitin-protein ligase SINA-like 7 [Striga hermonthica]|uniref:E3 ubiquitin-protein ligase SINA-like 7 n=1 Tax=Striga hermonthica TaxID=68872 RepID=A0A9N7N104_STRHE|nr:E3 ubiquitin-protein ligase SINA-like 7 [Striga hermonthica]
MARRPRTTSRKTSQSPNSAAHTQSPKAQKGCKGSCEPSDDEEGEEIVTNLTPPSATHSENCENGHVSCGACCLGAHNNCGSCGSPIGTNRNRALERVLDSMRVPCPNALYGCTEYSSFSNKLQHEKTCRHSPCSCPYPNCTYTGLPSSVYSHFAATHSASSQSQSFFFDYEFLVSLETDQRHVFLQEVTKDRLFVLSRRPNRLGSMVAVECIGPISLERKFVYEVMAADGVGFARLRALAETRAVWLGGQQPGNKYLFVPEEFVGADGKLKLEVTIRDRELRSARARK